MRVNGIRNICLVMPKEKVYTFETSLKRVHDRHVNNIIVVPDKIIKSLPVEGRIRAKGTFNKTPFALAIQFKKDATRYFSVSAGLMKEAKLGSGDSVKVRFWIVDPDQVDVPDELQVVLHQDNDAMKTWKSFTPAWQRGLAHYVNSVKNMDSRIKRAIEIMEKAKYGQLHGQRTTKKKTD